MALLLLFLRDHLACIANRAGGPRTHLVTVPSTRGMAGPHPLATLIGDRLGLPGLPVRPGRRHDDRLFHPDWFVVDPLHDQRPIHVLLIDDTWTTGARAQSLAHALKVAGATSVAVVVLGRHVRPEHPQSAALLKAIEEPLFDLSVCAAEG